MRTFRLSGLPELPARPLLLTIALFYLFGVLFHLLPATQSYMTGLTPYVLFVVGLLVLYPAVQERRRGILIWGALTFLVTFYLEALGVATGAVFGEYQYGSVLGAKLFGARRRGVSRRHRRRDDAGPVRAHGGVLSRRAVATGGRRRRRATESDRSGVDDCGRRLSRGVGASGHRTHTRRGVG